MGLSLTASAFDGSLDDLFSLLAETRPVMRALQDEKITRVYAKRLTTLIDSQWHQRKTLLNPKTIITKEIGAETQELRRGVRYPEIDLDMSLVLFPHNTQVITLIQTDTPSWRSLITSLPHMSCFDYWDGERPDDVSKNTWNTRKATWETLLMPDWIPANHGLVFTYRAPTFKAQTDAILPVCPTPEERALTLAKDLFMTQWIQDNGVENFTRGFFSMEKPEQAKAISTHAAQLITTLPTLTVDLINNGW